MRQRIAQLVRDGPLQRRSFRFALMARTASGLGDAAFIVVLLWLVTQVSDRPGLATGLATVALTVPTLVVTPALGPLLDRVPRARVLIFAGVLRAVLLGTYAGLVTSSPTLELLLGATVLHAALGSVIGACYSAGLPELVSDDELARANGWTQGALNGAMALGAGGAGLLLAATGASGTFATLSAASAAVAILSACLPGAALDPATRDASRTWHHDMLAGLRTVWRSRALRALIALGMMAVLGFAPALVALVALVDESLQAGPDAFGLLQTLTTVGLILGALLAPRVSQATSPATAMGLALLCMGMATAALGTASTVIVAGALVVARGLSNSVSAVQTSTLLQRTAPAAQRARVLTVSSSAMELPRVAAPVIGGVAVDLVGVTALYAMMGVLIGTAGLAALVLRPVLDHAALGKTATGLGDPQ